MSHWTVFILHWVVIFVLFIKCTVSLLFFFFCLSRPIVSIDGSWLMEDIVLVYSTPCSLGGGGWEVVVVLGEVVGRIEGDGWVPMSACLHLFHLATPFALTYDNLYPFKFVPAHTLPACLCTLHACQTVEGTNLHYRSELTSHNYVIEVFWQEKIAFFANVLTITLTNHP